MTWPGNEPRRRACLVIIAAILGGIPHSSSAYTAPDIVPGTPAKPTLVVQSGHAADISALAFSRDGSLVATASLDGTIWLWEPHSRRALRRLTGHTDAIWSLLIGPGSDSVIAAGADGTVRRWDTMTGERERILLRSSAPVRALALSPDGRVLAAGGERLWIWRPGLEEIALEIPGATDSVAFHADGIHLVAAGLDGVARLLVAETGREVRRFQRQEAIAPSTCDGRRSAVAVSQDGRRLALADGGPSLLLWDIEAGQLIRSFFDSSMPDVSFNSVALSPDGHLLLGGSCLEGSLHLWEIATGRALRRLDTGAQPEVFSSYQGGPGRALTRASHGAYGEQAPIAFSPDGKRIIAAQQGLDGAVLWSVDGQHRGFLGGLAPSVEASTVSGDGRWLATWLRDSTVRLWDLESGREVRRFEIEGRPREPARLSFSSNGHLLLVGTERPRVVDVRSGEARELSAKALVAGFREDENVLTVGADGVPQVWSGRTGGLLQTLPRLTGWMWSIPSSRRKGAAGLSRDGRTLVVVENGHIKGSGRELINTSIVTWLDIDAGRVLRSQGHDGWASAIALSDDAQLVAIASRSARCSVEIAAVDSSLIQGSRSCLKGGADTEALAFSSDQPLLAAGDSEGKVTVWDLRSGATSKVLIGHARAVTSVVFPAAKDFVITGGHDRTVRLWDLRSGRNACSIVSFFKELGRTGIVFDPEGRFDTPDLESARGVHWVMPDRPQEPLPLELFMREFFEPGLLPRSLARTDLRPVPDVGNLNRNRPFVWIKAVQPSNDGRAISVTVSMAEGRPGLAIFEAIADQLNAVDQLQGVAPAGDTIVGRVISDALGRLRDPPSGGLYDLRLFRNGRLVAYLDGPVSVSRDGTEVTFRDIRVPRPNSPVSPVSKIEFSAYAFNADGVKSRTARHVYTAPAWSPAEPVRPCAFIVSIGVDAYATSTLDLDFAVSDARSFAEAMAGRIAAATNGCVVPLLLLSEHDPQRGAEKQPVRTATKDRVRAVLLALAGKPIDRRLLEGVPNADRLRQALPDDIVMLFVASHGFADPEGTFYLVPQEVGLSADFAQVQTASVSSTELASWLRDIDAGELTVVIDACHAAAAVQGAGFKPIPAASRGLGQMAFDKGMRVLAATQARQVAIEDKRIRHGLLTYALVVDGLERGLADFAPPDSRLTLSEWLNYGVVRVPVLAEELAAGVFRVVPPVPLAGTMSWQHPHLFDFSRSQGGDVPLTLGVLVASDDAHRIDSDIGHSRGRNEPAEITVSTESRIGMIVLAIGFAVGMALWLSRRAHTRHRPGSDG